LFLAVLRLFYATNILFYSEITKYAVWGCLEALESLFLLPCVQTVFWTCAGENIAPKKRKKGAKNGLDGQMDGQKAVKKVFKTGFRVIYSSYMIAP